MSYVVGRYYMVPCIFVSAQQVFMSWLERDGWVPTLGPKHEDAEHLGFPHEHYHVDWRFVGAAQFRDACSGPSRVPHGRVVTNTHGNHRVEGAPELRRKRCARAMPDHPVRPTDRWGRLEIAQAFACNKLKPGNICPHRGIDLTPFEKPDGTAICPGHGLRWNLRTGELMPRHAP